MPTPSLFPIFLKAQSGGGSAGVSYIETFGLEVLEMTEVEVVDISVDVELVDLTAEIEVLKVIDVEILC